MAVYIYGVKIFLNDSPTVANATDIGLYSDAENGASSVIRWSTIDMSGYSPTYSWKNGVLLADGAIGDISVECDWEYGGGVPKIGGTQIVGSNNVLWGGTVNQLDNILHSNEIYLRGKICYVVRFDVSSGSLTDADGTTVYIGKCNRVTWDAEKFSVEVEPVLRRSNISTIIDTKTFPDAPSNSVGKPVPVTFGDWKPEFDLPGDDVHQLSTQTRLTEGAAKAIQTYDKKKKFTSKDLVKNVYGIDDYNGPIYTEYKAITSGKDVVVFMGHIYTPVYQYNIWYPDNLYIKIKKDPDNPDNDDRIFKVYSINTTMSTSVGMYQLYISKTFYGTPTSDTGSGDPFYRNPSPTTTFELLEIDKEHLFDVWPLKSTYDYKYSESTDINVATIYTHGKSNKVDTTESSESATVTTKGNMYKKIPSSLYRWGDSNFNKLVFTGIGSYKNINTYQSYTLVPADFFGLHSESQSQQYKGYFKNRFLNDPLHYINWDTYLGFSGVSYNMHKADDSVYYTWTDGGSSIYPEVTKPYISVTGDTNNAFDQDHSTEIELSYSYTLTGHVIFLYTINVPVIPNDLVFDSVYLCLDVQPYMKEKTDGEGTGGTDDLDQWDWLGFAEFLNETEKIFEKSFLDYVDQSCYIRGLPDSYYETNSPNLKDESFYVKTGDTGAGLGGYLNFKIPNVNNENYNSLFEINLVDRIMGPTNEGILFSDDSVFSEHKVTLKGAAFAFFTTGNIDGTLYSHLKGRTFNDTWGGRKTTSDIIEKPKDVIEHCLRLGNWKELGENKNWGKEYADAPMIETGSSYGGFESTNLYVPNLYKIRKQIKTYTNGDNVNIIDSLCKELFLSQYTNIYNGKEELIYIMREEDSATLDTITLDDIEGDIGSLGLLQQNVYCEPVIKYAQNNRDNSFDKVIKITNTSAESYSEDYVIGLTGDIAHYYWKMGRALYQNTGYIHTMPKQLSEKTWIYRDADAIRCLDDFFRWQGVINIGGSTTDIKYSPKKKISFRVPYDVGKSWQVGTRVMLSLPHQTNSINVQIIIEKVKYKIATNKKDLVYVEAIILNADDEVAIYIKDTMDSTYDEWKDNVDTFSERGSTGGNDVLDMT